MNSDLSTVKAAYEQWLAGAPAGPADTPSAGPEQTPEPPVATVLVPRVREAEFTREGYHLDVVVRPDQVVEAAKIADRLGFSIDAVTGVDWIREDQMEIVYDFHHRLQGWRVVGGTRGAPEHPALAAAHPGCSRADRRERETHEFFGIRFLGHPNLTPFLLPEDATYHPLRKDFQGAA